MSSFKPGVLLVAIIAWAGASSCWLLFALLKLDLLAQDSLRPLLVPLLFLLAAAFAPAVALMIEGAQALRGQKFNLLTEEYVSGEEIWRLVSWSPWWLNVLCWIASAAGLVMALATGRAWTDAEPLSREVACSIVLFSSVFFMLSVPIAISAYRMPGDYLHALEMGQQ